MKTKHYLLSLAVLLTALLGSLPHAARAQVKIGNNHQTIGTNSNLEVEAADGSKTIVDKGTGQVTIQDGTEGAGKILTSDANGASSWKTSPSGKLVLATMPDAQTTYLTLPANGTRVNLGASLTLPPGKWLVQTGLFMGSPASGGQIGIQVFLSSSPTTFVPPTSISNTVRPGFVTGQQLLSQQFIFEQGSPVIIDVASTTTYYLMANVAGNSNAPGIVGYASISRNVIGTGFFFAQNLDI